MRAGKHVSGTCREVPYTQFRVALTAAMPAHFQLTHPGTRMHGPLWAVCRIRLFTRIDRQIKTQLGVAQIDDTTV